MRASEPPPVLADCKGLSVTAAFFWVRGKQQDSAWGPIKDYSSWKMALAHGPEYAQMLIFRAVGAHSSFTSCATLAGAATHTDAATHCRANANANSTVGADLLDGASRILAVLFPLLVSYSPQHVAFLWVISRFGWWPSCLLFTVPVYLFLMRRSLVNHEKKKNTAPENCLHLQPTT